MKKLLILCAVLLPMVLYGQITYPTYTITTAVEGSGTVTPEGPIEAMWGSDVEFTFTPADGYQFDSVTYNSASQTQQPLRLRSISENYTVTAYFSLAPVSLTVDAFGQSAFTTTGVRTAIFVNGLDSTGYAFVTPVAENATAVPDGEDFLNVWCKTDSLIVLRVGGASSGLKFNYFVKK